MSTNKRIRGRELQRIRARVLRANPLCVRCQQRGLVAVAVHVDHIIAIVNGGVDDPYDDSNRQGLCDPCHEEKTRVDLGHKPRNGCDINGHPIGDHPWNS